MSYCDSAPAAKRLKTTAAVYFSIEVKNHGSRMLRNLNRARLEERFCDFKIQVGKQIIHAHKAVIAEGSDYFRAMLSHPMKESNEGIVEMVDVDFECLEICIEYIYLGKVKVIKEKLQSLLVVAHRLQLNELCKEVAEYLEDSLSLNTFFAIKSVATVLDLEKMEKKCDDFALKKLPGIALQRDFVKIELEYLKFLMTSKVPSAMKCKAFLTWANYDADNRGKEFEEFFLNLDLNQFPPSYMTFLKQNETLFFNSSKCMRKSLQSKLPTGPGRDIDMSDFRLNKEVTSFAVFDENSRAVRAYDPNKGTWTELSNSVPEIRTRRKFTAIAVDEDIFIFSYGRRDWKLRFSNKNSKWSPLPKRSESREVQAVKVDGLIYAVDETGVLGKVIEVYDGSKWSYATEKPVAGFGSYIVAVDGSIYCIGGRNGYARRHCYKYDTRKNCWSSLPPMPENRSHGCAAVLDRKVYVIGGFDNDCKTLATTLVFDIETEVWTKVASMSKPRCRFRAVPIAGKIYSICGAQPTEKTVEEFNPSTGKWRTVMTLNNETIISGASVAL